MSRFPDRDPISLRFYEGLDGPVFEQASRLYREGGYPRAAASFIELYTLTKNPAALVLAGNSYYWVQEVDQAIRLYRRAITEGLDAMPDVHYNLAGAYCSKYRREEAVTQFRRVLELTNDQDAMAHYHPGIVLDGEGQHGESIVHYKKAIELTGDGEPLAYQHLGVAYFMKGDYANAVRELEIYLVQAPDEAGGHVNLGIALRYLQTIDRAIGEFQAAIRNSNDQLPSAHHQLARIYGGRSQYALALKHFEAARSGGLRSPKIEQEYEEIKKRAASHPKNRQP